ncbi:hypothetical protein PthstB1num2_19830 [Parageobacillus thermoglucosidasius]|nr:hypothetical protein PthstB1num2_19830 [Parageobacillus thermoglucosidasius]
MPHAPKGGNPHHIVVHRVTHAKAAGYPWNTFLLFGTHTRQVWDLPSLPIKVTQHECEINLVPTVIVFTKRNFPHM